MVDQAAQRTGLFDLDGHVAVVTGAASGLGQAIAVGLASHGAAVCAADINDAGLADTVSQIEASGQKAIGVHCDVTVPSQVESMFERCEVELGPVDVLVNDAFVASSRVPSQDMALADWELALRVNLTGYFLCAQAAARRMLPRRGGSIINMSSITGTSGTGRGLLAYTVTKGAIVQLTRELAVEWGRQGVRVNAIQPVQIETPPLLKMIEDAGEQGQELLASFLRGIPLGRLGKPADLIGPVVFLASGASAMVTGVMLPVDGGNLATNAGATLPPL
jgi:NAD(P)-dependent dehydrogenase (short-subunit alcohol dehydrogenase family)